MREARRKIGRKVAAENLRVSVIRQIQWKANDRNYHEARQKIGRKVAENLMVSVLRQIKRKANDRNYARSATKNRSTSGGKFKGQRLTRNTEEN